MIHQWFAGAIAIIVSDLFAFFDILFSDEHQMRSILVSDSFGGKIAIAWMVDQASQFTGFSGGINTGIKSKSN